MWIPFVCECELFLIKFTKKDTVFEIFLNDLKNIWQQKIPEEDILHEFQLQNPLFDLKQSEAISKVNNLVTEINEKTSSAQIEKSFDTIQLKLMSKVSEFEVQFKFMFSKTSADMLQFLQEATVPFIQTIKYLEDQRMMLSYLLQRKDRELEEYKLEKGVISRTDLITEKFDENSLGVNEDKLATNIFSNSPNFWNTFVEQHGRVEVKLEEVEKEPWNHVKRKKKSYSAKNSKKIGMGINYTNIDT